jgi:hypothetical protein
MFALGALAWLFAAPPFPNPRPARKDDPVRPLRRRTVSVLTYAWLAFAVPLAAVTLVQRFQADARLKRRAIAIEQVRMAIVPGGVPLDRIAVVGLALPLVTDAYRAGGRIVAQIPPRSAGSFERLPAERQASLLGELFAGKADVVWLSSGGNDLRMLAVPASR